jgi:uncharacterized protein (TIGR02452 family)
VSARLREIARQTVTITEAGGYLDAAGRWIDVGEVAAAMAGTRHHLPDEPLVPAGDKATPAVEVTAETTLAAARRLGGEGDVAALVFASARNPGGGFLTGAKAQEEGVARASALYACLRTAEPFYTHHRGDPDLRYSDRVIYSPRVPVFRDDSGALLDRPYLVTFLTAAAPNLGAILRNQPDRAASVPEVLARRAGRVLAVAAAHGHRTLVLGAWGCGVFRNDPATVAAAFAGALAEVPYFDQVVFAVPGEGQPTWSAFASVFGS